jgi:hypothetical protein
MASPCSEKEKGGERQNFPFVAIRCSTLGGFRVQTRLLRLWLVRSMPLNLEAIFLWSRHIHIHARTNFDQFPRSSYHFHHGSLPFFRTWSLGAGCERTALLALARIERKFEVTLLAQRPMFIKNPEWKSFHRWHLRYIFIHSYITITPHYFELSRCPYRAVPISQRAKSNNVHLRSVAASHSVWTLSDLERGHRKVLCYSFSLVG